MKYAMMSDDDKSFILNNCRTMTIKTLATIIGKPDCTIRQFLKVRNIKPHKENKPDAPYLREPKRAVNY